MDAGRYHISLRALHWLMALGFAFMWSCGYTMTTWVEDDSPLEELLFSLHISVGVTLLLLLVFRIAFRLRHSAPSLPPEIPRAEQVGAALGHLGLYLLPAFIIAVGWAETDFGGHGVNWFGVSMPTVFAPRETMFGVNLEDTLALVHKWAAYGMLTLALVHVAAVAKHRWLDRHDVLRRITLGRES
ncbi:MAG: cytochrome b [bacterium]